MMFNLSLICFRYCSSCLFRSWKIPTMKLIFLLLGFAVLSYNVFESYNDRYCSTFESDDSRGTGFWVSQVLFICFFVMDIALAAFQVFVFRLDHVSAILFEVYLIVSIIVGVQTGMFTANLSKLNIVFFSKKWQKAKILQQSLCV